MRILQGCWLRRLDTVLWNWLNKFVRLGVEMLSHLYEQPRWVASSFTVGSVRTHGCDLEKRRSKRNGIKFV